MSAITPTVDPETSVSTTIPASSEASTAHLANNTPVTSSIGSDNVATIVPMTPFAPISTPAMWRSFALTAPPSIVTTYTAVISPTSLMASFPQLLTPNLPVTQSPTHGYISAPLPVVPNPTVTQPPPETSSDSTAMYSFYDQFDYGISRNQMKGCSCPECNGRFKFL